MKRIAALVGVFAVLGIVAAGCGGAGDSGLPQADPSVPFDRVFIDAMVPHHQQAIEMAKSAKAAGLSQPDLVSIADAIIATQQTEIDQMLGWRATWYGSSTVDPTGIDAMGMSMEQMGMQDDPMDLSSASDVDATFASMMVDHHNGAIEMARMALDNAEHPEIRELATAIIDAQQAELDVLQVHASNEHQM